MRKGGKVCPFVFSFYLFNRPKRGSTYALFQLSENLPKPFIAARMVLYSSVDFLPKDETMVSVAVPFLFSLTVAVWLYLSS